jgi:CubicO group peptidase (beta-lactamase class C family)
MNASGEKPANATNVVPGPQASLKNSLWALGIFGQMIMVNQAENLVIVRLHYR